MASKTGVRVPFPRLPSPPPDAREEKVLRPLSLRGDGELFAVSNVCTHVGCKVHWNSVETSWDCPCHGSRFRPDGTVIEGPALHPLRRKHPPSLA